jgi:hypothetical protein
VVEAFVKWLWEGSSASKVTAVDTTEVDAASIQRTTSFSSG